MPDQQLFGIVDRSLRSLNICLNELHMLCSGGPLAEAFAGTILDLVQRFTMEEAMLRARYGLNPQASRRSQTAMLPGLATISQQQRSEDSLERLRTAQELTRTLEEYFQFFRQPRTAQFFRRLRFELYDYERRLNSLHGNPLRLDDINQQQATAQTQSRIAHALHSCPLYFILDETLFSVRDPFRTAFDVVAGGVRVMQLRHKHLSAREHVQLARKLKQVCAERDCLLIINDRVDVALLAGADGVHLGMEDPKPEEVRHIAPGLLIGATARTQASAVELARSGADYIGAGSVFPSDTKPGLPVIRTAGLARIAQAVSIPVVAIGGITSANCSKVIEAGAAGFCAVHPFLSQRSAKNLVQEFRRAAAVAVKR